MSGTINSINTNVGAMVALESLNQTSTQLNSVQKQISTGYRVADAVDDGAAYAVAQSVRSDVGALTAANQQLGGVQALLSTTSTGLNNVSNILSSMRDVLVALANGDTTGNQRSQYAQQYNSMLANVKTFLQDANYHGNSLIGDIGGKTISSVSVVRNEVGSTYGIATFSGSALYASLAFSATSLGGAASVAALITAAGTFINAFNDVGAQLNTYGTATNYITNQIKYNSDKIDSLNTGLGALVDADLAKESAQLQALQIRQQLATQSLTL
ncbi:MAG TPA: flagellin, partial [Acetobacteraceae bacterium]|nr:flagellin [Acetobacteraceae bacterium]